MGIPVPGDSDHVMYVWIDALAIYLTAADSTINPDGTFSSRLWPADVQFWGKILPDSTVSIGLRF